MTELEFRPRFHFFTPLAADEVKRRIAAHVVDDNALGLQLKGTGHHLILQFPVNSQRSWTPQMDLDVEVEEGRTRVRCLIGPSPSIWMLFVGGYLGCVVLALLGISIGVAQGIVGAPVWGYLLVAPTPFIALVLWLLAQEGKRRSQDAMRALKTFVDEALGCDCFRLAEEE
ncbi:MAG: hypothetical protein JNM31_05775 [Flavobacteriales bacterium]|nr:hypothetical protein [Flavobacteriales bacterium]